MMNNRAVLCKRLKKRVVSEEIGQHTAYLHLKRYRTHCRPSTQEEGLIPPMSLAFSKVQSSVYAMCDEEGGILIGDTTKTGPAALLQEWMGHSNAIFAVDWVWGENQLITASGDKTLVLWDVPTEERLASFTGHSNSVKTLAFQPHSKAVFASGARDGHVFLWDARVQTKGAINMLKNPHAIDSATSKKKKQKNLAMEDSKQSVTCVIYQDDNTLISSGSIDGQIKVWDTRKVYSNAKCKPQPKHVFPYAGDSGRSLGFSNMVFDSSRTRLFCSCRDHVIYQYDCAAFTKQPVSEYRGHTVETYYVQMSLSPDDSFLLSGSSDSNAYIWEVDNPAKYPVNLKGHSGEVCSVAWSPTDLTELVTTSDDGTLRVWRVYRPTETMELLGQFVGTAEHNVRDCPEMKGSCRLVPDPSKCNSSQHQSPLKGQRYNGIDSPDKTNRLLMSPLRGTTLPHSPAKISSAVKHALKSLTHNNSQGCCGSKKALVNGSITRWFSKSSHSTTVRSPRKLIITPKKSELNTQTQAVQHSTTPHRMKGVKRKLADIYEEPSDYSTETRDTGLHNDSKTPCVKRHRAGEQSDRVLQVVCDNTDLTDACRRSDTFARTSSDFSTETEIIGENLEGKLENKHIISRTSSQCNNDIQKLGEKSKNEQENQQKQETPLKTTVLPGGHKTPVRGMTRCASSPPQYHSPTVDLPNYVMKPEPRTPIGRSLTLTPRNQTPDWLTNLRRERGGSSVKKDGEGTAPDSTTPGRKVMKASATPRSLRRANKSIAEFFSPKDKKK